MKFAGKIVIVTGAGQGIGESIARRFSDEGATVVLNDINLQAAEKVAESLKKSGQTTLAVKANVANKSEVEKMVNEVVSTFGKIDILVNNAGMAVVGPSENLEESRWRHGIDVMLTGVFFCSQAVGREMIKSLSGKIINIASISGICALPERACYGSAKAAVLMLTKILGCEWAKYNINVNAVAPGYVSTDLVKKLVKEGAYDLAALQGRVPLGRLAESSDVANAVLFLASDEANYIEGQEIVIDGGWSSYG